MPGSQQLAFVQWLLLVSLLIVSMRLCDTLTIKGSFFISDPMDEFTAHIDAPAEERVAEKQARLEGAYVSTIDSKVEKVQVEQV